MRRVPLLDARLPPTALPPATAALDQPDGLVAAGGALSVEWLRHAYRHGLFPWYSADDPILWWSPSRRMVFRPDALRVTRSLRQSIRNRGYLIGFDENFTDVVHACATRGAINQPPDSEDDSPPDTDIQVPDSTWIIPEMADAYRALHAAGDAHSVEVWKGDELVGGLYGVSLGGMFWGESMFSRARDASKVALVALAGECRRRGIDLIDAQFRTDHLASLGAIEMPREFFLTKVAELTRSTTTTGIGTAASAGEPWRRPPEPAGKLA